MEALSKPVQPATRKGVAGGANGAQEETGGPVLEGLEVSNFDVPLQIIYLLTHFECI